MKKIAILTWQDRFEKYDDQFANEFENTSVVQYGSDFSYDILRQRAEQIEKWATRPSWPGAIPAT